MINNFHAVVEITGQMYYSKTDLEDKNGNPTPKAIFLKKELAKKYLPQLEFDDLEEIIKRVEIDSADMELQRRVSTIDIDDKDLEDVE